jgi:glycerophosphoryl diester phosphodiesterase
LRWLEVTRYAAGIATPKEAVDEALVTEAHDRGLRIHPYTVNESSEMCRLLALGVDGLITDFPDRLDALLWTRVRATR